MGQCGAIRKQVNRLSIVSDEPINIPPSGLVGDQWYSARRLCRQLCYDFDIFKLILKN